MAIKGDSIFENTNGGTTEMFILEALLRGENVVIPDFGHLELKTLGERRTVLFKSNNYNDSFLKTVPPVVEQEKKNVKALYNTITIPLKEEKTVNLPQIGLFRPKKRENGEIHVDFTPSAYLRSILNNKGYENAKNVKAEPVNKETSEARKESKEIKGTFDIKENKEEIGKDTQIIDKTKKENNEKSETKGYLPLKSDGTALKPNKTNSLYKQSTLSTKVNEEQVKTRKPKRKNISGILLILAAVVFVLIIVISTAFSRRAQKNDEQAGLIVSNGKNMSDFISLPALAEKHYGNSAFWIYIYEANSDKLNSPINIPSNVYLVIPDLKSEYDVDITDSMEIQRANIKADIVLKKVKRIANK